MLSGAMSECFDRAYDDVFREGGITLPVNKIVSSILSHSDVADWLATIGVEARNCEVLADNLAQRKPDAPKTSLRVECSEDLASLLKRSGAFVGEHGLPAVTPQVFLHTLLKAEHPVSRSLNLIGINQSAVEKAIGVDYDPISGSRERLSVPPRIEDRKANTGLPKELSDYCVDLVELAALRRIDAVHGREDQIDRIASILRRRKKNNPILVGEPGVGKTAIVEGLAYAIAHNTAGCGLESHKILALDLAALLAGTRNRGDLEERLHAILKALERDRSLVLFIDETHMIVGASSGLADAANLLKPALASGRIRCIGATTHAEYARYFDADPALARRFLSVTVPEPSAHEAVRIAEAVIKDYEAHHSVTYEAGVAAMAVDLSVRHILTRRLPDKALDILDEAGALAVGLGSGSVTRKHIEQAVSVACGRSIKSRRLTPDELAQAIGENAPGQPEVCRLIAQALARSSSALAPDQKTGAVIAIHGGADSDRVAVSEAVAQALEISHHRLNLAEYREAHSLSRLIGSAPGYIGYGNGGRLTEIARRNPSCVIMLDHVDAAHPDIQDIIADIFDKGSLVDTSERIVSFAGVVFVLSLSKDKAKSRCIGFGERADAHAEPDVVLPARFENHVHASVTLSERGHEAFQSEVRELAGDLIARARSAGVNLNIQEDAINAVVDKLIATRDVTARRAFLTMIENKVIDLVNEGEECEGECVVSRSGAAWIECSK